MLNPKDFPLTYKTSDGTFYVELIDDKLYLYEIYHKDAKYLLSDNLSLSDFNNVNALKKYLDNLFFGNEYNSVDYLIE